MKILPVIFLVLVFGCSEPDTKRNSVFQNNVNNVNNSNNSNNSNNLNNVNNTSNNLNNVNNVNNTNNTNGSNNTTGTNNTNNMGDGFCDNASDRAIIGNPAIMDPATQTCVPVCFEDRPACPTCYEAETNLSSDCAGCISDSVICFIDNCLDICNNGTEQACQECNAMFCNEDLVTCSGIRPQ